MDVGCSPVHGPKFACAQPSQFGVLPGDRSALSVGAVVGDEFDFEVAVAMDDRAELLLDTDLDGKLLSQLSAESVSVPLSRLDLTAWKLPEAGHAHSLSTLGSEYQAVLDECRCDDANSLHGVGLTQSTDRGTQPWRLISPRYGRATSPATTWAFADSIFATRAGDSPAFFCTISKAMR